MNYTRHTIKAPIEIEGVGLHTGVPVHVTLHPGSEGIAFRYGSERTLARAENVTDTRRSTKVGSVGTVEHLMSALAGLEITDVEVELDAPELPGLDGSSNLYVQRMLEAGLEVVGELDVPDLYKRVFLQDEEIKVAISKGDGHWRYDYITGERWPNTQSFELTHITQDYAAELAPSRTFVLAEEIPMIIQHGLGKGLDESTVLVLGIDGYKNEARFPDEPARHKLLDLLGDLYLSGVPARALNVVGERTGHRTNVKAAALLSQAIWHGNFQ